MERKLGEIFIYKGKTYQVTKNTALCEGCAFLKNSACHWLKTILGDCGSTTRKDHEEVIFKEINNMEIKNNQLTIDIPEGMEIDLENSNLAKGVVKFKPKSLTYEDISQALPTDYGSLVVPNHNIPKLLAISKLMDIAKYFNGDWEYSTNVDKCGYMIAYDKTTMEPYSYQIVNINSNTDMYFGNIMFKNEADAQYVIDNPNFRSILDVIYKN